MTSKVIVKVYTADAKCYAMDQWKSVEAGRAVAMDIAQNGYRTVDRDVHTTYPATAILKVEVYEERRADPVSKEKPKARAAKAPAKRGSARSSKRDVQD